MIILITLKLKFSEITCKPACRRGTVSENQWFRQFMYSKKVIEHFTHPHNQGVIKNPDGVGMVGNPVCGDLMKIYLRIKKDKRGDIIKDIKFETLGCASAIATSSMITDLAKNKTLAEAKKVSRADVAEALEGLPPIKMHCSNLAADALHEAIEDYEKKKK